MIADSREPPVRQGASWLMNVVLPLAPTLVVVGLGVAAFKWRGEPAAAQSWQTAPDARSSEVSLGEWQGTAPALAREGATPEDVDQVASRVGSSETEPGRKDLLLPSSEPEPEGVRERRQRSEANRLRFEALQLRFQSEKRREERVEAKMDAWVGESLLELPEVLVAHSTECRGGVCRIALSSDAGVAQTVAAASVLLVGLPDEKASRSEAAVETVAIPDPASSEYPNREFVVLTEAAAWHEDWGQASAIELAELDSAQADANSL